MIIQPQDVQLLREAGRINGQILAALRDSVHPGMKTKQLDEIAQTMLAQAGATAPFQGYVVGKSPPYPSVINVSVNEELVHGIPGEREIHEGDIVTVDCGTQYQGLIADSALTIPVGEVVPRHAQLIQATEEALAAAIAIAKPGRHVGDLGFVIGRVLRSYRINIPQGFGGHGVGYTLHAAPHVANYGLPNRGAKLVEGMALAIEPMGMLGRPDVVLKSDGWTVVTKDGSACAHTEHTILITDTGAEILTPIPS